MAFKLVICTILVAIAISCKSANVDVNRRRISMKNMMMSDPDEADIWRTFQLRSQKPSWTVRPSRLSNIGLVTSQEDRNGSPEMSVGRKFRHDTNPDNAGNAQWTYNQLRRRGQPSSREHHHDDGVNKIYKN